MMSKDIKIEIVSYLRRIGVSDAPWESSDTSTLIDAIVLFTERKKLNDIDSLELAKNLGVLALFVVKNKPPTSGLLQMKGLMEDWLEVCKMMEGPYIKKMKNNKKVTPSE